MARTTRATGWNGTAPAGRMAAFARHALGVAASCVIALPAATVAAPAQAAPLVAATATAIAPAAAPATPAPGAAAPAPASASNSGPAAPGAASPTLARIARSGVVRIGYIPTPGTFAFQDARGETVGYSIDICRRVVERLRRHLGRPGLEPIFRPLKPAERIPLLKSGEIDIECGGNTNTAARQKEVDFSHTFFMTGARLLAPRGFQAERNADLWRKRIAVSRGTTAETVVNQLRDEQNVAVATVGSDAEGMRLLESGQVDAYAQDDILLYGLLAASPQRERLAVTGRFMSVEPYAFMLPKDDPALRKLVDETTHALMQSGEIVEIYRKWFDTDALRIPMSVYMKENIRFPNRYGIQ